MSSGVHKEWGEYAGNRVTKTRFPDAFKSSREFSSAVASSPVQRRSSFRGVSNTDAPEVQRGKHGLDYARTLYREYKSHEAPRAELDRRFDSIVHGVRSGNVPPVIVGRHASGAEHLIAGNTRAMVGRALGKAVPTVHVPLRGRMVNESVADVLITRKLEEAPGRGSCPRCGSNFPRDVLADHKRTCDEPMPERAPKLPRAVREHPWLTAAKKTLGLTDDYREAGFVTPNGQMIDLSGKNDGGPAGHRMLDHREVNQFIPDGELHADSGRMEHLNHFLRKTGAIRMSYHSGDQLQLHVHQPMTDAQKRTIARIPAAETWLDVWHPETGEHLDSSAEPHRRVSHALLHSDRVFRSLK